MAQARAAGASGPRAGMGAIVAQRAHSGAMLGAWLLAAGLALGACGASRDPARARLGHYIRAVARIEDRMQAPLSQVSETGRQITGLGSSASRALLSHRLAVAAGSLTALRVRLAALSAPASARTLRSLVLLLADRQVALARELSLIVVYPAAFEAALRPLPGATRTLARALGRTSGSSVAAVYAARARALDVLQGILGTIASRLRALRVPAVYAPGYRGELRALAMMRAAAGRLASALSSGGGGAGVALRQLDGAFALGSSPSLRHAEVAAVRAYDRQVRSLGALAARIQGERQRLSVTVP